MSVFLTHDGHFCHHEGFSGCNSLAEYSRKIGNDGDSGTGLMLVPKLDGPTVIIERDIQHSIDYSLKTFGVNIESELRHMKSLMDGMDGMRVRFNDINNRLEEIWAYLIGTPFDRKRAELLCSMNIQIAGARSMQVSQSLIKELWLK